MEFQILWKEFNLCSPMIIKKIKDHQTLHKKNVHFRNHFSFCPFWVNFFLFHKKELWKNHFTLLYFHIQWISKLHSPTFEFWLQKYFRTERKRMSILFYLWNYLCTLDDVLWIEVALWMNLMHVQCTYLVFRYSIQFSITKMAPSPLQFWWVKLVKGHLKLGIFTSMVATWKPEQS